MTNEDILFDSMETAFKGALDYRKKELILGVIGSGLLLLISFIKVFKRPGYVFLFIIGTALLFNAIVCWLYAKKGRLIIRESLIEITDGFERTKYYEADITKLTIEVHTNINKYNRVVYLKILDSEGNIVCKYHDFLNGVCPGRGRNVYWQEKINSLGAKIKANYDF